MTSYAGDQAIFEWKWWFFLTFFNGKNNLWMKWYKVRIYVLLYMSSTKNNHLSRFYVTCFLILGKIQDGGQDSGGSAWITSNFLVRPPQPKRLDSSILFSLVKLVWNYILATCRACSTQISLDSSTVFLKYAKTEQEKERRCWQGATPPAASKRRRDMFKQKERNFRI